MAGAIGKREKIGTSKAMSMMLNSSPENTIQIPKSPEPCDLNQLYSISHRAFHKSRTGAAFGGEALAKRLYMADLEVDTPDGSVPEPPGNYASPGFWSAYKSALLGMELRQWYTAHSTTFGYSPT